MISGCFLAKTKVTSYVRYALRTSIDARQLIPIGMVHYDTSYPDVLGAIGDRPTAPRLFRSPERSATHSEARSNQSSSRNLADRFRLPTRNECGIGKKLKSNL